MLERRFEPQDVLSEEEVEQIHEASMNLLENTGMEVLHEEAREIFAENGAKVEGKKVYLPRKIVEDYVEKAPETFTLHARNPENTVEVGGQNSVFAPGFGSPYVTDIENGRRESTYEDYVNFTKLSAASGHLDTLGGVLVEMNDIPEEERHVKMIHAGAKYSDKSLMSSALGEKKARDCFKMTSLLFGEDEIIDDRTINISIVSTTTPLKYDTKMVGAILEHARYNQASIIASLVMGGSTGPITIAGGLVLQNVEVLAGVVLAQMVNPGAPVVYGSASTITDMKTAALTVGSSEYTKYTGATAQLARYYGMPSRNGGVLTDSLVTDVQAGYESMMNFMTSMNYGINFQIHCAGLLENYMTMSYEKFVVDEEILGMVKNCHRKIEVNEDTLAEDLIDEVGHGGHYLSESHTLNHMKDHREPIINNRSGYSAVDEKTTAAERANEKWKQMLEDYEEPYLDPVIEKKLTDFMENL
ncbi:trimethylamine methyltransferase family protein [Acetohalobium arabaticum]|uniref:Methyltransferase n=1 Tax=Acetohalobium arabaticum (strain ATCC 49924 / DSM 5501 / Z-7288) TaxID=574087 RepID=D9QS67_ACEAZ|nr:trimethylamine methyltransferase family protein [Acetohalobium arabaticum]ADL13358.1 trimethylamine methyltransferase [Acetohalobium arabaticum DSM 5501]